MNLYLKLVLFGRNICIWWSLFKSWNFRKWNIPCRIEKEWPWISFCRIWIFHPMRCGLYNTIWKITHHIANIHNKNVLFGLHFNPFAIWVLISALNKNVCTVLFTFPATWPDKRELTLTSKPPIWSWFKIVKNPKSVCSSTPQPFVGVGG